METWVVIVLWLVSSAIFVFLAVRFIRNKFKYNYIGNTFIYIALPYIACFCFALAANLMDKSKNEFVAVASSFFDAVKMLALAFDKEKIAPFFDVPCNNDFGFGLGYIVTSALSLVFASITVVVSTSISVIKKIISGIRSLNKKNDICYIFSDPKAATATINLAASLKNQRKIVAIYLQRSLMKTQEGTEYRDQLISKGFDVRTENYSSGICKKLFNKFGSNQRVYVYGIFDKDDTALELCSHFISAIKANKKFRKLQNLKAVMTKPQLEMLGKYRVFVTYQHADIDLNNNFSERSLGIINTLSQYDVISTEFIMDNPLCDLIDLNEVSSAQDSHNMHVTFLGFGKVNRPIFEKMTSAYQLWGDNINKVSYHILDNNAAKLCAACQSDYTNPALKTTPAKSKVVAPYLYSVDYDCDGLDLTEFNTIDNHVRRIAGSKNRFATKGFDIYIVSVSETNKDIEIATLLRKSLLKNIPSNRLKNTLIYVRVGSSNISENFIKRGKFIIKQDNFSKAYMQDTNRCLVPIIIFGDNALMSEFVDKHYRIIDRLGIAAQNSYDATNKSTNILKTKTAWAKNDKRSLLENIATIYSLKTKLEIFGLSLDKDYNIIDTKTRKALKLSEYLDLISIYFKDVNYPDDYTLEKPLFKLASLEHNRWVAASWLIHKYSLWDPEDFIAANQTLVNGKLKLTSLNTSFEKSKHICMITNQSLIELRNIIIANNGELTELANRKTFKYDINQMKFIYKALYNRSQPNKSKIKRRAGNKKHDKANS